MALIPASQAVAVFQEGPGERYALYRIYNANTADTFDVAALFKEVKAASFIAAGTLATVGTTSASGTVLTLTLSTMAADNIYLLVVGQAAQ